MQIFSCSDDWDQLFHNGNIEQGHEYNMEMKGLGTVHSLRVFDYRPRPKCGGRGRPAPGPLDRCTHSWPMSMSLYNSLCASLHTVLQMLMYSTVVWSSWCRRFIPIREKVSQILSGWKFDVFTIGCWATINYPSRGTVGLRK